MSHFYRYSEILPFRITERVTEGISLGNEDSGAEIIVEWLLIDKEISPRILVYSDAFGYVNSPEIQSLLKALEAWDDSNIEDGNSLTADCFVEILKNQGFEEYKKNNEKTNRIVKKQKLLLKREALMSKVAEINEKIKEL